MRPACVSRCAVPRDYAAPSRIEHRKTNSAWQSPRPAVPTANAGKYMQQLCKHWSHKLEVDLSEARGVVKVATAVATFDASAEGLQVTIEGEEAEAVERMKGVVASHLDRFAFREAPLRFDWKGPGADEGRPGAPEVELA